MELNRSSIAVYAEEGDRSREFGWFRLQAQSAAIMQINFTNIPSNLVYGEHYVLSIFVIPSRCNRELCSATRVRLPSAEHLPCLKAMSNPMWFMGASNKSLVNNMTLYALDDLLFKVEIHITYGIFVAFESLFIDTTSVIIKSPKKAVSIDGVRKYATRQLTPYVSFEQKLVPMEFIFCAVILLSDPWSLPNNLPPQYSAYQAGRALMSYNVSAESMSSLVINTASTNGNSFYASPVSNPDQVKEMTDAYAETFHGVVFDPTNGYSYAMTSALLPYLPYFSNCYTFDNYISLWQLLEGDECALPDEWDKTITSKQRYYKFPALIDQDNVSAALCTYFFMFFYTFYFYCFHYYYYLFLFLHFFYSIIIFNF